MKRIYMYSFMAAMFAASLTGCGSSANTDSSASTESTTKTSVVSEQDESISLEKLSKKEETTEAAESAFTKRDLEQTADTSDAENITVSDGKTIDITSEGVYVISGTAEDCTIRVEADENAKVQLVLDGVSITNSDFPAIYVVSADKVFIITSGENMAIHAAANIAMAIENFKGRGYASLGGIILNRRDVKNEEEKVRAFAKGAGLEITADIPRSAEIIKYEDMGMTCVEGDPECETSKRFISLAQLLIDEDNNND